jgi:hypothetical protein
MTKPVYETSSIFAMGTTIGSGGTVSATNQAIDWSPNYEPEGRLVVSVGASPSGTVIARFLGGTAAADNATVLAAGTVTGGLGGTVSFNVDGLVTTRYVSAQVLSTGGTALVGANFVAKPRTVT